jgi:phage tail-like protein
MLAVDHTPPSLLLDALQGWQLASPLSPSNGLRQDADGALTLQPLPGEAIALADAAKLAQAGMQCPAGLASDGCGHVILVDAGNGGVFRIDIATLAADSDIRNCRAIERIDGIGGPGTAPRALNAARGIAALRGGGFAIADTGNARVQCFAAPPRALTQVFQDLGGLRRADAEPATLDHPWSVAVDHCGGLFVVDRGHRAVRHIDPRARTLANIGTGALADPTRIAVSAAGIVAVADQSLQAVLLFRPGAAAPLAQMKPARQVPMSVAFGPEGTLYVGDAVGLIHVFVPDATSPQVYTFVGSGDSRVTGRIVDLAWAGNDGLLALIEQDNDTRSRALWRIWPDGGFVSKGSITTQALDSDIELCQWHRILLAADFIGGHGGPAPIGAAQPGVASIEIETYTSGDLTATAQLLTANAVPWRRNLRSGDADPDCLVQNEPGRYLWLRVTLGGNGAISPRVAGARLFFPRQSYLQHLPAIYQDDQQSRNFLERFLSVFQTEFDDIDQRIDRLWLLLDPISTEPAFLQWLAGWVGLVIDPGWAPDLLRQHIRDAHARHLVRGTPRGIEQAINDYVELPAQAKVLEHFRLRDWATVSPAAEPDGDRQFWTGVAALDGTRRLWSRSFTKRLQLDVYSQIGAFRLVSRPEPAVEPFDWGAHRFTVFFPADPTDAAALSKRVAAVVEREKPAHTEAELCPVFPRMRVGRQAMVGVDSRIGGVSYLTLNRLATLSYDSILGCSPYERPICASGTSPRPRVGRTTVLQ